jgi:predicted nucleotide-binding protein
VAKIDPRLLEKLRSRLGLSKPRIYQLIASTANQLLLDSRLAAIALANANGIGVGKYASAADLAEIRGTNQRQQPFPAPVGMTDRVETAIARKKPKKKKTNTVWVVHGRNLKIRGSMFAFLRAISLNPLEFSKAVALTRKAAPYIGDILDAAFKEAAAVVVLLTPDDEARLRTEFRKLKDPGYEKTLSGQARPNVLFEAGTAFGSHPRSTVLVEIGKLRPFSDVAGRHAVRLRNDAESRTELANRLRAAGCAVDTSGTDWLSTGDFSLP